MLKNLFGSLGTKNKPKVEMEDGNDYPLYVFQSPRWRDIPDELGTRYIDANAEERQNLWLASREIHDDLGIHVFTNDLSFSKITGPFDYGGIVADWVLPNAEFWKRTSDISGVVSQKAKDAIERVQPGVHQFVEMDCRSLDGSPVPQRYYVFEPRYRIGIPKPEPVDRPEFNDDNWGIGFKKVAMIADRREIRAFVSKLGIFEFGSSYWYSSEMYAALKEAGCNYMDLVPKSRHFSQPDYSPGFVEVK